jgi:Membrane domain of glycerophosphoryl diester phosphodiesterase
MVRKGHPVGTLARVQPTATAAPLDLRRPRDLGALLGTTFSLYGRHFAIFAAIAFAVVVPVDAMFYGVLLGWFGGYDSTPDVGSQLIATYASLLIANPLITAMHVAAVMAIGEGRRPTLGETFVKGGDAFLPVLGALLLAWFFTVLGFITLIIPGIYVMVRLWVVAPAVVVEGHRGMGAIRRSWDLVYGNWWRIFGTIIVVGIIGAIAGGILSVPGVIIAEETGSGPMALASQILVDAISYSFTALTATLIFFDLKARKEGPPPGWYQQPPPPPGWQQPPPPPPPAPHGPERP